LTGYLSSTVADRITEGSQVTKTSKYKWLIDDRQREKEVPPRTKDKVTKTRGKGIVKMINANKQRSQESPVPTMMKSESMMGTSQRWRKTKTIIGIREKQPSSSH
jgi:hypothetical protein